MSTVNWKPQVLNCPWPLLSSLVLSCPALSWNLSLSTHHLHLLAFIRIRIRINKKNKQKKTIPRMLLNAIKNNITRMRGIKLLWFQKKKKNTTYYMGWHIHAYYIYAHICAIHTIYGISIFIKITPQRGGWTYARELHCQFNLFASSFCCFYCCCCCAVALLWLLHPRHVLNECHRISRQ